MKKRKSSVVHEMRAEYRKSDFPKGLVRGKYARRLATNEHVVVLDPDIAAAFPTSSAVNEALGCILRAARFSERAGEAPRRKPPAGKRSGRG